MACDSSVGLALPLCPASVWAGLGGSGKKLGQATPAASRDHQRQGQSVRVGSRPHPAAKRLRREKAPPMKAGYGTRHDALARAGFRLIPVFVWVVSSAGWVGGQAAVPPQGGEAPWPGQLHQGLKPEILSAGEKGPPGRCNQHPTLSPAGRSLETAGLAWQPFVATTQRQPAESADRRRCNPGARVAAVLNLRLASRFSRSGLAGPRRQPRTQTWAE